MLSGMRQIVASKMVSGSVGSICGKAARSALLRLFRPRGMRTRNRCPWLLHQRAAAQLKRRLQLSSALLLAAS
jgi:hypothetical protein